MVRTFRTVRRRALDISVADPTENWRWPQKLAWLAVGVVLSLSVAADRYGLEYDFTNIHSLFQVKDCQEAPDLCDLE